MNNSIKIFQIVLLTLAYTLIYGQSPIVSYDFDNCDASNAIGTGFDGQINGAVDCLCGLNGQSVEINDLGENIKFSSDLIDIFSDAFTIDFYFSLNNVSDVIDILSYRNDCGTDSLMSLKYFPANNKLLFELSKNIAGYASVETQLSDKCWNRFTFTREDLVYSVYLNNVKFGTLLPNEEIPMHPNSNLAISCSPCQPLNESYFDGRIDEFNIYDYPFTEADLRNTYLYPDQIINRDTTIFIGESVDINFGATCQNLTSWSPTVGLDDPTSLTPTATPDETTTYTATTTSAYCQENSEITIYIIDPNEFDCTNILLPKAFTPNGDQLNDVFGISNDFIVESIETFYIMDRWGNKVFETSNKSDVWDGTYNGQKLNPGSFTYVITYKCQGQTQNKVGSVLLLV